MSGSEAVDTARPVISGCHITEQSEDIVCKSRKRPRLWPSSYTRVIRPFFGSRTIPDPNRHADARACPKRWHSSIGVIVSSMGIELAKEIVD